MQAHDIIQREQSFQAKYGKKTNIEKNDVPERVSAEVTTGEKSQTKPAQKAPQYTIKNMSFPAKTPQHDKKDLLVHAAQCSWFKNDVIDSGFLNNKYVKDVNSNGMLI